MTNQTRKKETPQTQKTQITVGELLALAPGADDVHIMRPDLPLAEAIIYEGVIEAVPEEIREGYRVYTLCADEDAILLLVEEINLIHRKRSPFPKGEGKGRELSDTFPKGEGRGEVSKG